MKPPGKAGRLSDTTPTVALCVRVGPVGRELHNRRSTQQPEPDCRDLYPTRPVDPQITHGPPRDSH